jgi:hypothetical protein
MSDCEWLSDRMPVVALGRAEWSPDEVRHLNECGACQREWHIVAAAARLGENAWIPGDSGAIATSLIQRIKRDQELGRRKRAWSFAGLAAAATIAAAVWTGSMDQPAERYPLQGSVAAGRPAIPLPELDALQPTELDSVLKTMDDPNSRGAALEDPGLADLDTDELQTVLDSWEG